MPAKGCYVLFLNQSSWAKHDEHRDKWVVGIIEDGGYITSDTLDAHVDVEGAFDNLEDALLCLRACLARGE